MLFFSSSHATLTDLKKLFCWDKSSLFLIYYPEFKFLISSGLLGISCKLYLRHLKLENTNLFLLKKTKKQTNKKTQPNKQKTPQTYYKSISDSNCI